MFSTLQNWLSKPSDTIAVQYDNVIVDFEPVVDGTACNYSFKTIDSNSDQNVEVPGVDLKSYANELNSVHNKLNTLQRYVLLMQYTAAVNMGLVILVWVVCKNPKK